jgi:hypothetical protein
MVPSPMPPSVNGLGSASFSNERNKPPLLCLPPETLDAIFAHVRKPNLVLILGQYFECELMLIIVRSPQARPADLVNLSLVSRAFRDLAAAQLYRSLQHVFTDDDTRSGQLVVDRLAGILETLTTSDYNYARYIKEISLDTAYSGEAGERASREFRYDYSCGKFLNTLLLATIKKISALETFR